MISTLIRLFLLLVILVTTQTQVLAGGFCAKKIGLNKKKEQIETKKTLDEELEKLVGTPIYQELYGFAMEILEGQDLFLPMFKGHLEEELRAICTFESSNPDDQMPFDKKQRQFSLGLIKDLATTHFNWSVTVALEKGASLENASEYARVRVGEFGKELIHSKEIGGKFEQKHLESQKENGDEERRYSPVGSIYADAFSEAIDLAETEFGEKNRANQTSTLFDKTDQTVKVSRVDDKTIVPSDFESRLKKLVDEATSNVHKTTQGVLKNESENKIDEYFGHDSLRDRFAALGKETFGSSLEMAFKKVLDSDSRHGRDTFAAKPLDRAKLIGEKYPTWVAYRVFAQSDPFWHSNNTFRAAFFGGAKEGSNIILSRIQGFLSGEYVEEKTAAEKRAQELLLVKQQSELKRPNYPNGDRPNDGGSRTATHREEPVQSDQKKRRRKERRERKESRGRSQQSNQKPTEQEHRIRIEPQAKFKTPATVDEHLEPLTGDQHEPALPKEK